MARPRPPAGRAGLFLDPNQIAAWFHPLMFRTNIWVVIAILLVLFAVTRCDAHAYIERAADPLNSGGVNPEPCSDPAHALCAPRLVQGLADSFDQCRG